MSLIHSFPPIADTRSVTLILGTMPGRRSLEMKQYYAHPQNLFWPFLSKILGAAINLTYKEKIQLLKQHQIALWDVLQYCEREGSLDSQILANSEITNDMNSFLTTHPHIKKICFNGRKAFQLFQKHILKLQPELKDSYRLVQLPSTSPANASISQAEKLSEWKNAIGSL